MKLRTLLDDTRYAVEYHDMLNPKLWTETADSYTLDDTVKSKLIEIARKFIETLKLPDEVVEDYVITGSNVNYNWTSKSDIDLHVILDKDVIASCKTCKVDAADCLLAKKTLWNEQHDIHIHGIPVELYATTEGDKLITDAGTYSLLKDRWITHPAMKQIEVSAEQVKAKVAELDHEIKTAIKNKADDTVTDALADKIWRMRKAGLEHAGEFSVENVAFKALRNSGVLDQLRTYRAKNIDAELSLP